MYEFPATWLSTLVKFTFCKRCHSHMASELEPLTCACITYLLLKTATTSSSFPSFRGVQDATIELRKLHSASVTAARQQQGIAPRNAGSFEIELAHSLRLQSAAGAAPSSTFTVTANQRWNPSGFPVQKGEQYSIVVSGAQTWTNNGGAVTTDANGYTLTYDAVSALASLSAQL
jgi:hypothetical protein